MKTLIFADLLAALWVGAAVPSAQSPTPSPLSPPCSHDPRSGRVGWAGTPAKIIQRRKPDLSKVAKPYPTGIVLVEAGIDDTGKVRTVCLKRGLRDDVSAAAIGAFRQWRFSPARTPEGQPWPVVMTFTVAIR